MGEFVNTWKEQSELIKYLGLGQYGGGDSQKLAKQILKLQIKDKPNLPTTYLRTHVVEEANLWITKYSKLPNQDRIASIPHATIGSQDEIEWSHFFCIFDEIVGEKNAYNLMFQQFLFDQEIQEKKVIGASSWPLIGVYESEHFESEFKKEEEMEKGEINQWTGMNTLNPADQHCHFVEEIMNFDGFEMTLSDWHFGSDMAKFNLIKNNNDVIPQACTGWVVCVCPIRKIGQISLLILLKNVSKAEQDEIEKSTLTKLKDENLSKESMDAFIAKFRCFLNEKQVEQLGLLEVENLI